MASCIVEGTTVVASVLVVSCIVEGATVVASALDELVELCCSFAEQPLKIMAKTMIAFNKRLLLIYA